MKDRYSPDLMLATACFEKTVIFMLGAGVLCSFGCEFQNGKKIKYDKCEFGQVLYLSAAAQNGIPGLCSVEKVRLGTHSTPRGG